MPRLPGPGDGPINDCSAAASAWPSPWEREVTSDAASWIGSARCCTGERSPREPKERSTNASHKPPGPSDEIQTAALDAARNPATVLQSVGGREYLPVALAHAPGHLPASSLSGE
jgi:hypothetical protein